MEEIAKRRKNENFGQKQALTSQCRESKPRRRPTPRRGMPRCGEIEVPKSHPSGMTRRSIAALWRSYYS